MYAIHSTNRVSNFKRKHSVQRDQCTEKVNHIKINRQESIHCNTFKGKVNIKNNKIIVIWHRETQGTVLRQTDSDT